ncbi:pyridoxamine 5'-phosphate oxidase family protein [Methylobacillus arboreus]|uniref:pyridoxamine 5'-phosphate oxidase family protein n=1 Tax=Methylobacillus arboreus TaxID=755170 RepID=UPI001E5761E1|nr:pyridoxamine 5'-phosphate oxidase family protein [Methylobacillus arboreus]MCB5190904.1 pyridoxamine 5'-phosphate oxidase family protein [Methylobacillus arboreus]
MTSHFSSITSISELRAVYDEPAKAIRDKALPMLDKYSRRFIELSPFFCISSHGPEGLGDVSPRGGEPGFVHVLDDTHIVFPDRPGNNRLDTLTNMLSSPGVGMLFFLPGIHEMLRINGQASITLDEGLMQRFVHQGKQPRAVIVVEAKEVYMHCSKGLKRSELWNPDKHVGKKDFPSLGQIAKDQYKLFVPAKLIDLVLDQDAKKNLY